MYVRVRVIETIPSTGIEYQNYFFSLLLILLFSLLFSLLLLLLAVLVTCAVFSFRTYFLVHIAFFIFSFAPSFSVKSNYCYLRCYSGSSVLTCIFL